MVKKDFIFRGYSLEELQKMSMDKFIELLPSRKRKSLTKGPLKMKKLLMKIRKVREIMSEGKGEIVKTHYRDMVVLPEMVGLTVGIHNGKEFNNIEVIPEMIGHFFGEFALTRKKVKHSAPGIGATKSSLYVPLK